MIKDCVWGDYFCQDCFNATHATGKRRGHITEDIEQLVCAVRRGEKASRCLLLRGRRLLLLSSPKKKIHELLICLGPFSAVSR